jgi:hypothetical protein
MTLVIRNGSIYECEHTDGLYEVVHVPETGARHTIDTQTIALKHLDDGRRYGVYHDTFRKDYEKVADSLDDLSEADQ